jgi:TRAP-type C4-dicarboxylate transport system substrate-binding protein
MPEAVQPLRLGGYQGEASILTAALQRLGQWLGEAGWRNEVQADVTAQGESARQLFASLEGGTRQLGYMASGYLAARVPELGVLDLPFSVSDRAAAMAALDGEGGALLREAVRRRTGYEALGFWDNGFRHLSNSQRALRRPADCTGLVIRTLDNQAYRDLFAALGFTPVTTDVKELVAAVESGRVQAQENPLTNLLGFGLWKHHPHVSLSGHLFGVLLLLCPRAWYDTLTAAQRNTLHAAAAEATTLQRRLAAAQDDEALARLRELGVAVLGRHELDLPAFRAAAAALAETQRSQLPPALLRAYLSPTQTLAA